MQMFTNKWNIITQRVSNQIVQFNCMLKWKKLAKYTLISLLRIDVVVMTTNQSLYHACTHDQCTERLTGHRNKHNCFIPNFSTAQPLAIQSGTTLNLKYSFPHKVIALVLRY